MYCHIKFLETVMVIFSNCMGEKSQSVRGVTFISVTDKQGDLMQIDASMVRSEEKNYYSYQDMSKTVIISM